MSAVYLCAGLLLGLRYYNHAQYKSRQQRDRQQRAQVLRPGSELGRRTSMTPGLVSLTAQASAAAGGQIYMVGVAVLLPVAFTLIGKDGDCKTV